MPETVSTSFTEAHRCETPGQCAILGQCQRAFVIIQEMNYAKGGQDASLQYAVDGTTCDHEQAAIAISQAIVVIASLKG